MPGTASDSAEPVKKGLRGLFSRRKKPKAGDGSASGTSTTSSTPSKTSNAPGAAAGSMPSAPGGTTGGTTGPAGPVPGQAPRVSEPAQVAEAKAVDLDPSSHVTGDLAVDTTPAPPTTTVPKAAPEAETTDDATPATPKLDEHGMSATSGPLSDPMDFGQDEEEQTGVPDGEAKKEDTVEAVGVATKESS